MTPVWSSALVALSMASSAATSPSVPRQDFHKPVPTRDELAKGPATRFANLSPSQCRQQLKSAGELGKAFKRQGPANGVATPLRMVGPLGEVKFRVPSAKTMYGILDCRQALLWIHLLPTLRQHKIAEIQIDNFYRNRARIRRGKKSQHAYGLAADITWIKLDDGTKLVVLDDFFGKRGEDVCGPRAAIHPPAGTSEKKVEGAVKMRDFVCDLARQGAFHGMLTPNFNAAHENHFHFDIKRDSRWFTIRTGR